MKALPASLDNRSQLHEDQSLAPFPKHAQDRQSEDSIAASDVGPLDNAPAGGQLMLQSEVLEGQLCGIFDCKLEQIASWSQLTRRPRSLAQLIIERFQRHASEAEMPWEKGLSCTFRGRFWAFSRPLPLAGEGGGRERKWLLGTPKIDSLVHGYPKLSSARDGSYLVSDPGLSVASGSPCHPA